MLNAFELHNALVCTLVHERNKVMHGFVQLICIMIKFVPKYHQAYAKCSTCMYCVIGYERSKSCITVVNAFDLYHETVCTGIIPHEKSERNV